MVNLPLVSAEYVEAAQELLSKNPLVAVVAQLLKKSDIADRRASDAYKKASESEKRVQQALTRMQEFKSIMLQMSDTDAVLPSPQVSQKRQKTPPPHTRSFGGDVFFSERDENKDDVSAYDQAAHLETLYSNQESRPMEIRIHEPSQNVDIEEELLGGGSEGEEEVGDRGSDTIDPAEITDSYEDRDDDQDQSEEEPLVEEEDYDEDETGGDSISKTDAIDIHSTQPSTNNNGDVFQQDAEMGYPESDYGEYGSVDPIATNTNNLPAISDYDTPIKKNSNSLHSDADMLSSPAPSDPEAEAPDLLPLPFLSSNLPSNDIVAETKKIILAATSKSVPLPKKQQKSSKKKKSMSISAPKPVGPSVGTPLTKLVTKTNNDKEARILRMKINIGDEVELFGNQTGVMKFAGEVQFAKGNYFGLEYNDGSLGKNNGDVDQIQYFTVSKPMKGVFVRAKMIRRKVPLTQRRAFKKEADDRERAERRAKEAKQTTTVEKKKRHEKEKAGTSMKKEQKRVKKMGLQVGDDVQIDMGRKGMVAYIGVITMLHPKHIQYGIALTHGSIGDTDGTLDGVEYFHVDENRGCFVTADKIRKKVIMSVEEKYAQRIEDIFEEHAPKKLPSVRKLIKDADNLHLLYVRLCNKYSVKPAPEYRGKRR